MKKIFFITSLILITFARADIKFDTKKHRFYSIPASPKIDLNEYNRLILQITIIGLRCWNQGIYGKEGRQQMRAYFKKVNTPTSLRLLADCEKDWQ